MAAAATAGSASAPTREAVLSLLLRQGEATAADLAAQLVVSYTKGILAGTRTQTDRLNAIQREAEARRDLLQARYQWVLSMVKLKLLCGESHTGVMEQINASVLLNR
jgi:outer membrane protein TolC